MSGTGPGDRSATLARWVSRTAHPLALVPLVLLSVGAQLDGWTGAGFGLLATVFVAGIPGGLLWWATRAGRVVDMDVSRLDQRPLVLGLTLVSLLVGTALLVWAQAPRQLLTLLAAMAAGVVVAALVSRFWKASIHTACAVGAVTVLALLGPTRLAAAMVPVALLVGWARVRLGAHSTAQVVAGAAIGTLIPALVLAAG